LINGHFTDSKRIFFSISRKFGMEMTKPH
jgi:hypothetical protein